MALDHRDKARECYKSEDYEGYLDNARKQYKLTGREEDLEEYEKARKVMQLSKEIQQIIESEGDCHYKVLGVDREAPMDEIKKAFRDKAAKYHPSRTKIKGSHDAMRIIQKAYFEINTEEKRAAYDLRNKVPRFMRGFVSHGSAGFSMAAPSFTYASSNGSFAFSTTLNTRFSPFEFGSNDFESLYSGLYRNAFGRYRRRPQNSPAPSMMPLAVFLILIVLILLS